MSPVSLQVCGETCLIRGFFYLCFLPFQLNNGNYSSAFINSSTASVLSSSRGTCRALTICMHMHEGPMERSIHLYSRYATAAEIVGTDPSLSLMALWVYTINMHWFIYRGWGRSSPFFGNRVVCVWVQGTM